MLCERGVLFEELDNAVGQLGVVKGEASNLVQGDQHLAQKLLMFGLQRQGEAVNDAAENFQKFTHAIKMFSFIDEPKNNKVILDTIRNKVRGLAQ